MRERMRDDERRAAGDAASGGEQLAGLHEAGDQFAAAAEQAIHRGLSTDSQEFLRSNRQESGQ